MTRLSHVVDGPAEGGHDAPVLLLGGSLGSTVDMWLPQVPRLSRRMRVVRFDHRGHGGSPVPPGPYELDDLGRDVLELLDHLGVRRAHYAGLSLGGMVGMWLAAHAPGRVDRLALLCTAAHLPPAQGWLDRAAEVRAGGMEAVAAAVVRRWFTDGFGDRKPYETMVRSTPVEGYAACCETIAALDLRPALASIGARTLVIAGAQDPATPPSLGEEIAAGISGARLAVIDGAAHLSNVERPERVTALLTEFLEHP